MTLTQLNENKTNIEFENWGITLSRSTLQISDEVEWVVKHVKFINISTFYLIISLIYMQHSLNCIFSNRLVSFIFVNSYNCYHIFIIVLISTK